MVTARLLDTELYKLPLMQAVPHQLAAARVARRFTCPSAQASGMQTWQPYAHENHGEVYSEIHGRVRGPGAPQFRPAALALRKDMRLAKSDFADLLALFHLNENSVSAGPLPSGALVVAIKGQWWHTVLAAISALSSLNEVYFCQTQQPLDLAQGRQRLVIKIDKRWAGGR